MNYYPGLILIMLLKVIYREHLRAIYQSFIFLTLFQQHVPRPPRGSRSANAPWQASIKPPPVSLKWARVGQFTPRPRGNGSSEPQRPHALKLFLDVSIETVW